MRMVSVANGVMDDPQTEFDRWVRNGDMIVAADGGSNHLLKCGMLPHHIIGDLDSISPEMQAHLQANNIVFHTYPPNKDETDLEIATLWAAKQYPAANIVILGAMGGRPDQATANLLLLALPALQGSDVIIAENHWVVRVIRSGETQHLSGSIGDTLSLIALGGHVEGVTTTGLRYPLTGETLYFGPARGVSNAFEASVASVSVASGTLWVFHKNNE